MYTKDLERLVRGMLAQHLDPVYIRCYLVETYQLSEAAVSALFAQMDISTQRLQRSRSDRGARSPGQDGPAKPVQRRPFS
jgi:hypothetical protein